MRIFITGTPGTGKSTIAKALSKVLRAKVIELSRVAVAEGLIKEYDEDRKTGVVEAEKLKRALLNYLRGDKIIIVGHMVEAVPKDLVDLVVVLRLHPLRLRERLKKRAFPEVKVRENVEAELLDYVLIEAVKLFGKERVVEVDVTDKDTEEASKLVLQALFKPEDFKPGKVDWISKLESEGTLNIILQ